MNRPMVLFTIFTVGSVGVLAVAPIPVHIALPWVAVLVTGGAGMGWWQYGRAVSRVIRAGERTRRHHGVASTRDILRRGSGYAVRRRATIVRPSLAKLSWLARLRLPTSEMGVLLGRAGWLKVWASVEDAIAVFGGPRFGKTGYVAGRVIDAPGAVFCTSTRLDLKRITETQRGRRGPILTYNPAGYGGDIGENGEPPKPEPNTLAFNPLVGCHDPQWAMDTAEDMIPAGFGDAEEWRRNARRILGILMHAAALEPGLTMHTVHDWAANPELWQPSIRSALQRSPERGAYLTALTSFIKTNDKTRTSITNSIMPSLAWLYTSAAVASLDTGAQLDVPALLRSRGTVYIIGREKQGTSGLTAALTGRIIRETRLYATRCPGGRCDPPPLIAADEAARTARLDWADITGDAGGNGIIVILVFQSQADIAEHWGPHAGARILTNCGHRILYPGTADADELDAWSKLAGERDEIATNYDQHGNRTGTSTRKVPVLSSAVLTQPGDGNAVIFHRLIPPVIAKMRMAWRRPDVRNTLRWRLVGSRVARWRQGALPPLTQVAPTPPPAAPGGLPGFTHPSPTTTSPSPDDIWTETEEDMA